MNDIVLMMDLSRSYDVYLTKSSRLEILRYIGMENSEVASLGWDCWTLRKDAYRALAKIYDNGGDEDFLRFWAGKFGWDYGQLSKPSLREWLCKDQDTDLADPAKPGGASDYSDPNPVEAEHVYVQMAKNFPPDSIEWIRRAKWTGPVWVPWNRVDQDDRDKWAASHHPEKVKEFERMIKAHDGHVAPSVMVQEPNSQKAFIVDGHHRAVAREKLKQDVLAYLGNIDARDRQAAEETHSHQIHQGSDPENKQETAHSR